MKKLIVLLVLIPSLLLANPFTWDPPTHNTDGTVCNDIKQYNIYVAKQKADGTWGESFLEESVSAPIIEWGRSFADGIYKLEVTAEDHAGNESDKSDSLMHVVMTIPLPPANFRSK